MAGDKTWSDRIGGLSGRDLGVGLVLLCALRVAVVAGTAVELGPDEAQYWRWSRALDWGYYSKPPLIAWVIAATTGVFGNGEWAIRLAAPIAHAAGAWVLFLLGRRMFSHAAGVWAAIIYAVMPGVWLSSTIMSTDALLLPLWSAALYYLWRMREAPTALNGVLFGVLLGLATLAKYAGLYLLGGAVILALIDAPTRRALLSLSGIAALVGLAITIAPNFMWNAANDFATVSHTADNTDWEKASLNFDHLPKFITDQMGVFGPITFLVLIAGAALLIRKGAPAERTPRIWLLVFVALPLLIITVQAVIARAHANWAASAYPAASVLVASWIAQPRWGAWIKGGAALNAVVGAIFLAIAVLPPPVWDSVGLANAFKRVRGWDKTSARIVDIARENGATAIMTDEREVWHGLDYYTRDLEHPPLRAWRLLEGAHNFAEQAGTMQPGEDGKVLIASIRPQFRPRIRADFASIEPLGDFVVALGPYKERRMKLYLASGYQPLPRTPEYLAEFEGQREE
jgi:4-amino-4-deoxy-L-arabinose transferase-like glycosyltransferase